MRVVGGTARGRRLLAPPDERIRPTADRVREALFNILGPVIADAQVCDLFAGTGALGIEALSRGATACVFVENAPAAARLIEANLQALGMADRARLVRHDALSATARLAALGVRFDVVLADPPYRLAAKAAGQAQLAALFDEFAARGLLAEGAVAVLEHGADSDLAALRPARFVRGDRRTYGDTALTFFDPAPAGDG